MKHRPTIPTWFALLLSLCLLGCDSPSEDRSTLGSHTLIIIDTSGTKPYGGTTGTRQDDVAGTKIDFFESANGNYQVKLVGRILTINGSTYTLENEGSEIRIVGDRIEINGVAASEEPQDSDAAENPETAPEEASVMESSPPPLA